MFHLSSLSATPEWVYSVGAFIIVLVFLLGGALLSVKLWREVKGDQQYEPLQNPSIDKKLADSVDRSEMRTGKQIGAARAEANELVRALEAKVDKDVHHLHGRVSSLRDELRADYKQLANQVQAGVDHMNETYTKTVDRMSAVEANTASQERRIISHETKLDRHLEKGCPALNQSKS